MEFKDRVKELREENGLLQRELASKIGVARTAITGWEGGTREPNIKTLVKLANYFDCSLDYLLGRVDNKKSVAMSVATTDLEKLEKMTVAEYLKLIVFFVFTEFFSY